MIRNIRGCAQVMAWCGIGALSITAACGPDKPEAKSADDMAGMPGMDSAKSKATTVTFSAAQIEHGKVKWAAATRTSIADVIELPGQIVANDDRTARLSASSEGRVVTVHVNPGERVAKGDALVTLQSAEAGMAQSDVAKAQAELGNRKAAMTFAQTARSRAERLLALKSIPRQDYERALADEAAAAAALSQAEAELARATAARNQLGADAPSGMIVLRSPMDGVVIARDAVPGAVVSAGAALVTVTDPGTLWLTASANEHAAQTVHAGTRLRFSVDAFAADTFAAIVQSVAGAFDPSTRSLPIRALVTNDNRKLRPEMFAKVWIDGATATNAFIVPDSAVQRLDDKATVFVAHPDGKGGARFDKREVEVRWTSGGRAAIARGLVVGDLVVVSGAYAVKAEFARSKLPKMEM